MFVETGTSWLSRTRALDGALLSSHPCIVLRLLFRGGAGLQGGTEGPRWHCQVWLQLGEGIL